MTILKTPVSRALLTVCALGGGAPAAWASNCSFWKDLLCATPIAMCAGTAGLGGAGPMYRCIADIASWCGECVDGYADPRDHGGGDGGSAGAVCGPSGCHFGQLDSGLTMAPQPATPGPWRQEDLGGVSLVGAPSLIEDGQQKAALYAGPNGHLWLSTHPLGGPWWSAPADLGGVVLQSPPSAIAPATGVYRVFYKGPNGHLWMSSFDGGPWWSAPADLGGVVLQSAPSAVALDARTYRVFYKGPNGHLWQSSWDGGPWWSAPADLGGIALQSAPAAVAVTAEPRHLAVFYVGPNRHLTMSGWDGGPWWSAPTDLGGVAVQGELSAVSPVAHEIDVFYAGPTGELLQSQWTGGPWWSAPYPRAIYQGAALGALSGTEVYLRAADGHLSVVHP